MLDSDVWRYLLSKNVLFKIMPKIHLFHSVFEANHEYDRSFSRRTIGLEANYGKSSKT